MGKPIQAKQMQMETTMFIYFLLSLMLTVNTIWGQSVYPSQTAYPLIGIFGMADGGNIYDSVVAKENLFSQKTNCVMSYIYRDSWNNIQDPSTVFSRWRSRPEYKKIFSVPMLPSNTDSCGACIDPGTRKTARIQSTKNGAEGKYDSIWMRFSGELKSAFPTESVYIRLGWEFNCQDCGFAWAAYREDSSEWKIYFRRIVDIIRNQNPNAQIVFCSARDATDNTINDKNGVSDTLYYPGDNYVDVIGIDVFDKYKPAYSENDWEKGSWDEMNSLSTGIGLWSSFAKRHNKPFSIPEWGLVDSTMSPNSFGGDNPFFVQKIFDFVTDGTNNVVFAVYTQDSHGKSEMGKGLERYRGTFSKIYKFTPEDRKKLVKRKYVVETIEIK
jgi:hypothetical protein